MTDATDWNSLDYSGMWELATRKPTPIIVPDNHADLHRYVAEFERAADIVGVPCSWANNRAIVSLIHYESGFDPTAKNKNSTAFGLWQFLRATWDEFLPEVPYGNTDPFWQTVGGFRYIRSRYGTPERAKAFRDATLMGDPKLAPRELRGLAQRWIDQGYVGY